MKCWATSKYNPANMGKDFKFNFGDYANSDSLGSVVEAITAISTVAKSQRKKEKIRKAEELEAVEE